jgi:hypothetical protein
MILLVCKQDLQQNLLIEVITTQLETESRLMFSGAWESILIG